MDEITVLAHGEKSIHVLYLVSFRSETLLNKADLRVCLQRVS